MGGHQFAYAQSRRLGIVGLIASALSIENSAGDCAISFPVDNRLDGVRNRKEREMKEYKIVPGPTRFQVKKGEGANALKEFETIINTNSTGGWEFHSMETITIMENPGCLGGGAKNAQASTCYMLIFVRNK